MAKKCIVKVKNLGKTRCTTLPSLLRGFIETDDDFFLTPEEMANGTAFQAAMLALVGRAYLWPFAVAMVPNNEEAVYEETPLADINVRDGKYRMRFMIKQDLCMHKAMFTHRRNGGRAFLIDIENQIIGTEDENGNVRGLSISLLNTEKFIFNDGSVSTKSPVYLVLANNKELDSEGVMYLAPYVNTLERLTDAELEIIGDVITTAFEVQVSQVCDGEPISGLLVADFIMKNADGTAQAITSVTESVSVPGLYAVVGVGFATGDTITLSAPSLLTVKAYESTGPAVLEITP